MRPLPAAAAVRDGGQLQGRGPLNHLSFQWGRGLAAKMSTNALHDELTSQEGTAAEPPPPNGVFA